MVLLKRFLETLALVVIMTNVAAASQPNVAEDVWYKGSVADAFAEAAKLKKPVFVYWGAVWCPPCNEIKNEVFAKPEFKRLMEPFVALYLDGDTDRAQIWGEKLKASGYPTILLFDSQANEVGRIDSSLSFAEFEVAITNALNANRPIAQTLSLAKSGQLQDADWRMLAYLSWDQLHTVTFADGEKQDLLASLISKIPAHLGTEKILLQSKWLSEVIAAKPDLNKDLALGRAFQETLENIFRNQATLTVARSFVIYGATDTLNLLDSQHKSAAYVHWRTRFASATAMLASNKSLSIDTRLWAKTFAWELFKLENGSDAQPPVTLVDDLKKAVAAANAEAKSPLERHAVVSGAAYILRKAGATHDAKKLLLDEIKTTDTPWYYYSGLVGLANEMGDTKEALAWSKKARETAQGSATKLQWIVSDLLLAMQHQEDFIADLNNYYNFALALPDGFVGRNGRRAETVLQKLKPHLADKVVHKALAQLTSGCGRLTGLNQEKCREHFQALQL